MATIATLSPGERKKVARLVELLSTTEAAHRAALETWRDREASLRSAAAEDRGAWAVEVDGRRAAAAAADAATAATGAKLEAAKFALERWKGEQGALRERFLEAEARCGRVLGDLG